MVKGSQIPDFTQVTELPGVRGTREEISHIATRYRWAADRAAAAEVLELAAGHGPGTGLLLAAGARQVVLSDLEPRNLNHARRQYAGRPGVSCLVADACHLPVAAASFDLVLLFEAAYYLPDLQAFLAEVRRVLRPGGRLLISSVNCEWPGFNPSPYSTRYLSASEWIEVVGAAGFATTVQGAFPDQPGGPLSRVLRLVRRLMVVCRLMPHTQRGKEWLKRMAYGPLRPIPAELAPDEEVGVVEAIDPRRHQPGHVFLFIEAIAPAEIP